MEKLPLYIGLVFGLTTLLTVFLFYKAGKKFKILLIVTGLWIALQSLLAITGFYEVPMTLPPRFLLAIAPPLLVIAFLFSTIKGRRFLDQFTPGALTLLHVVRIPVELVLWWLSVYKWVPVMMTFEGRNLDIFCGITAPLIWYWGYRNHRLGKKLLIAWNMLCIVLLMNIVIIALLSAPVPFQQLSFDIPNKAILHFPFLLLPAVVVPIVLLAHLICLRNLLYSGRAVAK